LAIKAENECCPHCVRTKTEPLTIYESYHDQTRPETKMTEETKSDFTQASSSTQASATSSASPDDQPKKRRGFGAMSPEKQRQIASAGGLAAHAKGTARRFTQEEAKIAGAKGGAAVRAKRIAEKAAEAKQAQEQTHRSEQAQASEEVVP
jgi:hypothetical protein